MSVLRLKQGATLALDLLLTDDLSSPINLTGAAVTVVVCDPLGSVVATLPLTTSASQGWGTVSADTSAWPIGTLAGEVHVISGGMTQISDTFQIVIERPVTQ